LIIISHDRDFLDGVVNVIAHIDDRKLKRYGGNYSQFERQRAINLSLNQATFEKQSRERAHLQSFIDRFKAKASKAKQAQSRMKMLAKMEDLAPIHAAAAFQFEFRDPERAPNPLLVLENVVAGYHTEEGDKPILSNINLNLQVGQRIGLLGVNGAGKSTLIKTIAGELAPLTGDAHWGKGLAIGYFAQHQVEMLRHDQSPLWHLAKIAPSVREQELRNFLGGFNFPGTMVSSPIAPFSGGEKARLALALIVWQRPNLLLLDEPTNHLDLETREALTIALAQFEGTLVLVSHDRHLLRATTEEFLIVADGSLKPFDGDLDDYRDWLFKTKLAVAKPAKAVVIELSNAERKEQKRQEAETRQRLSAQKKPVETRIKRLEEKMAKGNIRKAELDRLLADPGIYAEDKKEAVKSYLFEQANLAKALEQLEGEWLEQQNELEGMGG
jgi:ATP-binding cassette subfamily F protein 3